MQAPERKLSNTSPGVSWGTGVALFNNLPGLRHRIEGHGATGEGFTAHVAVIQCGMCVVPPGEEGRREGLREVGEGLGAETQEENGASGAESGRTTSGEMNDLQCLLQAESRAPNGRMPGEPRVRVQGKEEARRKPRRHEGVTCRAGGSS